MYTEVIVLQGSKKIIFLQQKKILAPRGASNLPEYNLK
jgi:hypothetical protein